MSQPRTIRSIDISGTASGTIVTIPAGPRGKTIGIVGAHVYCTTTPTNLTAVLNLRRNNTATTAGTTTIAAIPNTVGAVLDFWPAAPVDIGSPHGFVQPVYSGGSGLTGSIFYCYLP